MLTMTVFVLVVCGLVVRRLSAEERMQLVRTIAGRLRAGAVTAREVMAHTPAGCDEFYTALRARTRWTVITPAIVFACVTMHVLMRGSGEALGDRLLVEWGASVGPLTTNAEWSRLVTAMFVHRSWLHLVSDIAGLVMAGALIERIVGRGAFTVVFFAAGMLGGLWRLAAHPVAMGAGASGAIFGVYGLLAATMIWGFAQRSPLTIPAAALKPVWPGAIVFLVYHFFTDGLLSESMQAGALVGLVGGLILAARVSTATPPVGRVCAASVAFFAIIFAVAIPLRGIADVPAALARLVDVEERTAARYDDKIKQFRNGRITADELAATAEVIEEEVRQVRTAITALRNIPAEHVPMLLGASRFLQLREDSWRLRVEALRQGRMQTLQKASVREFEAKRAFETVIESLPRS